MKRTSSFLASACCIAALSTLAACSGTTDTVTTDSSALLGAQCTYDGFHAVADACFATYETCATAAGADVPGCLTALHQCLPPPPQPPGPGMGPGMGPGGCPGDGDGGRPPPPNGGPPPPNGGQPPPPPPDADGGRPPPPPDGAPPLGGGPHGDDGHRGPPPPLPDPAAIHACRDALDACLVATPADTQTCRDTERACVKAAFDAAFQQRCDEAAQRCTEPGAPADKCAEISDRCAQGVAGLPQGTSCP